MEFHMNNFESLVETEWLKNNLKNKVLLDGSWYLPAQKRNPYKEYYDKDIVASLTKSLHEIEVEIISLSDTIGVSSPNNIASLFSSLISEYPNIEFGAHFHTTVETWKEKIDAAYSNGCKRFDSTLRGYGGCPMSGNHLVGNMPTEKITDYFNKDYVLNEKEFSKALKLSESIFNS